MYSCTDEKDDLFRRTGFCQFGYNFEYILIWVKSWQNGALCDVEFVHRVGKKFVLLSIEVMDAGQGLDYDCFSLKRSSWMHHQYQ